MSRFYFFCLSVFFAFLFSSCKKKDNPVESKGDPVFYFKADIDGNPVSLKAGENDYYMYSSYVQDANKVYNFLGDLKQANCTNCKNAIQFRINDYKVSTLNAQVVIDSSLLPQSYALQLPIGSQTTCSVNFKSFFTTNSGASVQSYSWDFGDGIISSVQDPTHTYAHYGNYNVCLTVNYASSSVTNICRTVKIKNSSVACIVNRSGNASIYAGKSATLTASFGAFCPAASYFWSTGETTSSISVSPSAMKSYNVIACCPATGCCDTSNVTVFVSSQSTSGLADFNYYVDTTNVVNPYSLSSVTVTWKDNAGVAYTSNNFSQSGASYFQVVSVEDYLKNQNNQPTKKLHVKFKCNVFNGNNSHVIDNGEAIIAVSYK